MEAVHGIKNRMRGRLQALIEKSCQVSVINCGMEKTGFLNNTSEKTMPGQW